MSRNLLLTYLPIIWVISSGVKVRRCSRARAAHRPGPSSAHGTPLARGRGGGRQDRAQPFRELDERARHIPGRPPCYRSRNASLIYT